MIDKILQNIIDKKPIIHNITNYVTATDCANITLTIGASPIMASEPLEAYEVTSIADGLVLNTGTISEKRLNSMFISGKAAQNKSIPIILDPVGVGISKFRTNAINEILLQIKPDIIRLNATELKSICLSTKNISGIDSSYSDDFEYVLSLAKQLSIKTNAIIGVSGIYDIVTNGTQTAIIKSGHEMMRKITGAGCMLTSATGAFAAANPDNLFNAVTTAFAVYGMCGKRAYRDNIGVASYKNNFFDEMTNPNTEGIEIEYR